MVADKTGLGHENLQGVLNSAAECPAPYTTRACVTVRYVAMMLEGACGFLWHIHWETEATLEHHIHVG